ncbi:MAG TPA: hypothetical protein VK615_08065, partial [Candidatus Binatia bacterium]|nr:hypothetical protein [Candidatus Binatia bacterium]
SQDALVSNAGAAATGPAAWPVSRRPELKIRVLGQTTELSWLAPENAFTVQNNGSLNPPDWAYILGGTTTYTSGRNIMEIQFDTFANMLVYRLISQ